MSGPYSHLWIFTNTLYKVVNNQWVYKKKNVYKIQDTDYLLGEALEWESEGAQRYFSSISNI